MAPADMRGETPRFASGATMNESIEDRLALLDDTFSVIACGRSCNIPVAAGQTVIGLQNLLQHQLQMDGQAFHLFDCNGTTIITDAQLKEAVMEESTPLCATLTDASIHFIENKREELAQMQWKLVRDQLAQATTKITSTSRQVFELQNQLQVFKKETHVLIERTRNEAIKTIENERDSSQAELKQVSERVNAVAQLANMERNKREVALHALDQHVRSVCDMVDEERSIRRQELSLHVTFIQDCKTSIEDGTQALGAFEDRHSFDMRTLNERIDTMSRHYAEMLHDQMMCFKQSLDEITTNVQQQNNQIHQIRAMAETSGVETSLRHIELEEHSNTVGVRLNETCNQLVANVSRLEEDHGQLALAMENLGLRDDKHVDEIKILIARIKDVETMVMGDDMEDAIVTEQQGREDRMKRAQQVIIGKQNKKIAELERRLAEYLEGEPRQPEEKRKINVNETYSKTVESPVPEARLTAPMGNAPVQSTGQWVGCINTAMPSTITRKSASSPQSAPKPLLRQPLQRVVASRVQDLAPQVQGVVPPSRGVALSSTPCSTTNLSLPTQAQVRKVPVVKQERDLLLQSAKSSPNFFERPVLGSGATSINQESPQENPLATTTRLTTLSSSGLSSSNVSQKALSHREA